MNVFKKLITSEAIYIKDLSPFPNIWNVSYHLFYKPSHFSIPLCIEMLLEMLRNSEDGHKSEAAQSSNVTYQVPLVS
jgi:hypothetical protein